MEHHLENLVEQNERILAVLERIADSIDSIASAVSSVESYTGDIKYAVDSVHEELQWHKELSMASQLIKAVDNVTDAVQSIG